MCKNGDKNKKQSEPVDVLPIDRNKSKMTPIMKTKKLSKMNRKELAKRLTNHTKNGARTAKVQRKHTAKNPSNHPRTTFEKVTPNQPGHGEMYKNSVKDSIATHS